MSGADVSERRQRKAAVERAEAVALAQDGVISRRQLYAAGVTRWQVKARTRSRRWQSTGRQTICITTGPLSQRAQWWVATLETGPRAALDGVTALLAAGLKTIAEPTIHVIAPKSSSPRRTRGVRVHESRRFNAADVLTNGIRRVRPAVAAVHAALWAGSDRQAALFLVAPVQQRLVRVEDVQAALELVLRHPRRRLLRLVLADVADGAHSLNELDFTSGLRRRELPPPSRQVVVTRPGGRVYLDAEWDAYDLRLELDGSQHDEPTARLSDALRDLETATMGKVVVRLPLLALRLDEEAVYERLAALLQARGWARPCVAA